jgi:flagellar hook-length control protein FliK
MFQFPMLASAATGLLKGAGPGRSEGITGLEGLLQAADGAMAGFSGDLQAMLMQLTPQMLQRLDELLAGGMNLPQAAKSLLAEAGFEGAGDVFADLLKEGLPRLEARSDAAPLPQPAGQGGSIAILAEHAIAPGTSVADLVQAWSQSPAAGTLPVQSPGPITPAGPLPPQVAASLLDMGVPQQVGGKAWEGAIADRITWMVQGEQQFAKLQLNPPNLGPLEVRVSVNQDQTSVSFMAQHAAVREALEAALPRLRDMFEQQSMQLVRADVSDPGAQQGERAHDRSGHRVAGQGHDVDDMQDDSGENGVQAVTGAASSLIDLFA